MHLVRLNNLEVPNVGYEEEPSAQAMRQAAGGSAWRNRTKAIREIVVAPLPR